jgi:riboflavin synthase
VFTGLIADLGEVSELDLHDDGATLHVQTRLAGELQVGDSIALDGVCLTACAVDREGFQAHAIHETLTRSALGSLTAGSHVNLELALRADGRLGGHVVQGHVDGTATVAQVEQQGLGRVLSFEVDPALERYLVFKGSVAVNGVSLTISSVVTHGFSVSLIPETLERTNLGRMLVGNRVNVEADILAKHVERLMETHT